MDKQSGKTRNADGKRNALPAILVILTVVLMTYSMPADRSRHYEFAEDKPWIYDELIAPVNFSIEKGSGDYLRETDSVRKSFIPYFTEDTGIRDRVVSSFQKLYDDTLRSFLTPDEFRKYVTCLDGMYSSGIIDSDGEDILNEAESQYLRKYSGNTSHLQNRNGIFTMKEAYKHLQESASAADVAQTHDLHLERFVIPNLAYDSVRSKSELAQQISKISRYSGMVMANQKIVDRGEIVDHETYQIIVSYMDMIKENSSSRKFTLMSYGGHFLLISIVVLILVFYLYRYRRDIAADSRKLVFLLMTITVFTVCTNLYLRFSSWSIFILPCTMLAVMLRIFLDSRTAFLGYLTYLMICSAGTPMPFEFLVLQTVSGLTAIYSLRELTQRSQIYTTTFTVLVSYCITWLSLQMIQIEEISQLQWNIFIFFAISCVILLLTYPLVLAVEKLFGFTSNVTLIELSNFNHPLLRELSENAPGTFQHSTQVSALAAEAANAIGASTQLVRTAAMYHDIGKLSNPPFFTENQNGVNPHDKLPYMESARIITNHVDEGLRLAAKYHLPDIISHFITTHHGNGMAKYFFIRYQNEHPGETVDRKPFSYSGNNPDSKETAILMMADAVEAGSRSLKEYTAETISGLVDSIIDTQTREGHFDGCPITLGEIGTVKTVLKNKLKTMYHTRISYPSLTGAAAGQSVTSDQRQNRQ